jgi:GNAT superfamily N-acetyltransferase
VHPAQASAAFESQQRRQAVWASPSRIVEVIGPDGAVRVVRYQAEDPDGWAAVVWSDLAGLTAPQVEAMVAEQAGWAHEHRRRLEWKYYHHDRPAGLSEVLVSNGFEPGELETVMVADVAGVATDVVLTDGVRLLEVHDEAGLALVAQVATEAFGTPPGDRNDAALHVEIARQLRESPRHLAVFVVVADDGTPVSEGRVELPAAGDFAGLWGGATVTEWRRRGIYRALVAHRAAVAAERGFRWLMVDASSQSRPILASLGFVGLASTTPHVLQP